MTIWNEKHEAELVDLKQKLVDAQMSLTQWNTDLGGMKNSITLAERAKSEDAVLPLELLRKAESCMAYVMSMVVETLSGAQLRVSEAEAMKRRLGGA